MVGLEPCDAIPCETPSSGAPYPSDLNPNLRLLRCVDPESFDGSLATGLPNA
jgi:hypothetical protein